MNDNLVYCPALEVTALREEITIDKVFSKGLSSGKTENSSERIYRRPSKLLGIIQFQSEIVWFNAIGFLFMHLAGAYGVYLSVRQLLAGQLLTATWMNTLLFLSGEGVTLGAHRLWCHRSFKANNFVQIVLIILHTIAGQNCLYIWVRDHRQHHKYSDTNADPHNANRGFFFSHIGWLMMRKHPDVIRKGKDIDMSDMEANPIVMFQKKYYKILYFIFAMAIPVGVPIVLWNESIWNSVFINFFARYIVLLNITWCVNSVAHMFGTKPYDKNIFAVESPFVAFIGLGEGWHNYHHVFPWDYKASEFGTKINLTTWVIDVLAKIGWVYDLRTASDRAVRNKILKTGDKSHKMFRCVEYIDDALQQDQNKSCSLENEDETESGDLKQE